MSRSLAALTLSLAVTTAACAAVFGFERLSDGRVDGGTDAATESAPSDPTGCSELGIRERPSADQVGRPLVDGGAAGAAFDFFFAARSFDLGNAKRTFNLDGVCTLSAETASCANPRRAPAPDKDGGGDTTGDEFAQALALVYPGFTHTTAIQEGQFGLLFSLQGWNGTEDDDLVFVRSYPALGLWRRLADGGLEPSGPPESLSTIVRPTGQWDDHWMLDAYFRDLADVSLLSDRAWVRGGQLAAHFPSTRAPVRNPGDLRQVDVVLRDAWIVADLAAGDGDAGHGAPVLRNLVLTGRWSAADILRETSNSYLKAPVAEIGKAHICTPRAYAIQQAFWDAVCKAADIRESAGDDRRGLPCDALSAAISIETYPVASIGDYFDQSARLADAGELSREARCKDVGDWVSDAGCNEPPPRR